MSDPTLGEIRLFAGNFPPVNYQFCNGQLLAISQNEALYTVIGTTYGGDGQTTFALPDFRGRVPIHQGQGAGLNRYVMGEEGGAETVALLGTQTPLHHHAALATTAPATTGTAGGGVTFGSVTPNGNTYALYTSLTPPTVTSAPLHPFVVATSGAGQPHDNTMLTTPINFIIAVNGTFPTFS